MVSSIARIASYNISGAVARDRRFYARRGNASTARLTARAKAITAEIAEWARNSAFDVLALQEVDVCYNGGETFAQGASLADALGMEYAFLPGFDYHFFGHLDVTTGVATLVRGQIVSTRPVHFSQNSGLKSRLKAKLLGRKTALHTRAVIKGRTFHIVNAHLTHDDDAQKLNELETVLTYCRDLDPVLIMGDLNTTPHATRTGDMIARDNLATDGCMRRLARLAREAEHFCFDTRLGTFVDSPAELLQICSFPAHTPTTKLDYVFLLSKDRSLRLGAEEIPEIYCSNHRPVATSLTW